MISEDSYIYICMFWIVLMISDVLWHCSHFSGWWFLIPRVQEKSTPGPWGLQGCAAATWGSHCGLHLGAVAEYPRSKSGWTDFWLKIFKIDNHVLFWIQFHQLKLYGGDFSKKNTLSWHIAVISQTWHGDNGSTIWLLALQERHCSQGTLGGAGHSKAKKSFSMIARTKKDATSFMIAFVWWKIIGWMWLDRTWENYGISMV